MLVEQSWKLIGITPMLMHNGQTADPLNQFSKEMKRLSSKRNKTEEDLEQMSLVEWWAGLYLDKQPKIIDGSVTPQDGTKIVVPAHLLDSCVREGARKSKLGKQASAGCIVNADGAFSYGGESSLVEMSTDGFYIHRAAVKVGQSKVMRTRPVFSNWSVTFTTTVDTTVIEIDSIFGALQSAGKLIGIGDWRPGAPRGGSFGRFDVEALT